MESQKEIRDLISRAFHEIYDHPLEENALDCLFEEDKNEQFQLSDLDFSTEKISDYIQRFLGCIKHSFVSPIAHHGEFDCF